MKPIILPNIHNPHTSSWTISFLLVRIISEQEQTNVSSIFQGSLQCCTWYSTRILFNFERATMKNMQLLLANVEIKDYFFYLP